MKIEMSEELIREIKSALAYAEYMSGPKGANTARMQEIFRQYIKAVEDSGAADVLLVR